MIDPARRPLRSAMTLVELLVVIGIVGILVGLLMPAVSAGREAARKVHCKSNLTQLAKAIHRHHELHRHFPTNGWGYRWVGDANRGFGINQPGGWVFNLLPYIEQQALRDSARTQSLEADAHMVLLQSPLALLNCPSRRAADVYPYNAGVGLRNSAIPEMAAKSDYAINAGDKPPPGSDPDVPGPLSDSLNDVRKYNWPAARAITGISYVRSKIRIADVKDGTSNTLMIGEKHIPSSLYNTSRGDDQSMYIGDDGDIRRWTLRSPLHDADDGNDDEARLLFGSRHSAGCHIAFCDGSVRLISYSVDPVMFLSLGNRHDYKPIDHTQF